MASCEYLFTVYSSSNECWQNQKGRENKKNNNNKDWQKMEEDGGRESASRKSK